MNLAIDGITALTISPLRIASYTSFLTFLSFIIYLLIILVKAVKGIYINYIILTIIFFSGLNMIFLGIIGEYLGRVFIETKGRPIYFVDEYNGKREDNK